MSALFNALRICTLALLALAAPPPLSAQVGALAALVEEEAPDEPLEVGVGVMITQITGVDQKAENYGVVARIRLKWFDEKLAFDSEALGRNFKSMSGADFVAKARELGVTVPVGIIENQQARSFSKSSSVTWGRDGTALYANEIIVTLQAPDFDFRRFPFDHQNFFFRLLANAPSQYIRFVPLPDASGLGDTLGEEEWVVATHWTEVDEVTGLSGLPSSRFSLGFSAHRHLLYYWARIFIPVILLILIGWANLFLPEYRRRIDIASGNLLAFIALNFTISSELPRLGYLTFIDSLLMAVFMISVVAVIYNVALQRLSMADREDRARAIDWHVTYWGYPLIFILVVAVLRQSFFQDSTLILLR